MPSNSKTFQFLSMPAMLWQLMLVLWLGAHLAAVLIFIPLLVKAGFAPMLIHEVNSQLRPALLLFTLMATAVQMLVLVRAAGFNALVRQLRGQLLLAIWPLALIVLLTFARPEIDSSLVRALYGVMLGCGLVLLTQPLPKNGQ